MGDHDAPRAGPEGGNAIRKESNGPADEDPPDRSEHAGSGSTDCDDATRRRSTKPELIRVVTQTGGIIVGGLILAYLKFRLGWP